MTTPQRNSAFLLFPPILHSLFLFLFVFTVLSFTGCSLTSLLFPGPDPIAVRGTQFVEGDRPYYVVGTNYWYGPYLGSTGRTGDRPRLLRELDTMAANGITNLRILGGAEASPIPWSLRPSFQYSPGVLDDSLLAGLDFLLAEMGKRKMRAVIFLTNYWEWSGGVSSYNLWSDSASFVDPVSKGWDAYMDSAGAFYSKPGAQTLFRNYIRTIVQRTNSITGKRYAEDPTIMSWQLANEPRSGTVGPQGHAQMPSFVSWVESTSRYIKSLDSLHLVSTGSEGVIGSLVSEENFVKIHAAPSVDYLTFHCWPGIWHWFDAQRPEETWLSAESLTIAYLRTHIALARKLNKPLVLEEFGLVRDRALTTSGTPVTFRDRLLRRVYQEIADSAAAGAPIAGSNIWAWGGEAAGQPREHRWEPGEPLLGDPPHEPQGMHAIFNADTSSRRIIAEHAAVMRALRQNAILSSLIAAQSQPKPSR